MRNGVTISEFHREITLFEANAEKRRHWENSPIKKREVSKIMQVTFYKKDSFDSYSLFIGKENDKIGIMNNDGEGGDFNADEVCNVVFEALDKYFKQNF